MPQELLQVGDKIEIRNIFNLFIVEIDRVTKTTAITKPYNKQNSIYKFKRIYYSDNNKGLYKGVATKIPSDNFSTTEYRVI